MATNTTSEKNATTEKSIVKVNNLVRQESFTAAMNKIRDLTSKIDFTLRSVRKAQAENADRAVKPIEKKKPTPPPAEVVSTPQATEQPAVEKKLEPEKQVSAPVEKKPAPAVEHKQPEKKQAQPAPEKKTKVKIIGDVKLTQTMSEGDIPSYIKRNVVIPPVYTPPKPQRTPNNNANGNRPQRPAGAGQKPFEKNGNKPFTPRPQGGAAMPGAARPAIRPTGVSAIPTGGPAANRRLNDKKKEQNKSDVKTGMNKRTLIRKGYITEDMDEERMGTRKFKNKKVKEVPVFQPIKIEKAVITTENLTVKILSEKIGKTAQEIIKQLMLLGIMTNINSVVDFPTMELVANELGVELELKLEQTKEAQLEAMHDEEDKEEDLVKRPPIITVMGHVDHGKTSLLDALRKTSVVAGEAGGITQHIGAYSVQCKGETITFLDTPGHEAFTEMRARGALITDIVILIVAADDGIMPQTVEAINHAKAANVPIIVAINKIDKAGANQDKVKQSLTEYGLVPEEWGGDTMVVPISAKQGINIDKLLENILLLAEVNDYRANPRRQAKCAIIESKLDKGKGPVANVIVRNGTLRVGDFVVSGVTAGRVRAMVDDKGRNVKEAGPSTPVSVLGFADVPNAGDAAFVVDNEKMAKQVVDERESKLKTEAANQNQKITLDDMFNKINEENVKELNVIIKADVQGSVEALRTSLVKLANEEVKVSIVHGGVGAINKSDVMLAGVSKAIIIGFNVRPDTEAKATAEATGIEVKLYNVIYEAIDDITAAMNGLVAPKYREVITGRAQVRSVFKISSVGEVAGSYVINGKIVRNSKVRIYRDNVMIFEGNINNLKRFKDDAKEVATGYECGISVEGFVGFKENDEIESYVMEVEKK